MRSWELNWQNTHVLTLPKGEGADAWMAFLADQGTGLLANASSVYDGLNEFAVLYSEYKFWGRVVRLGRAPEPL